MMCNKHHGKFNIASFGCVGCADELHAATKKASRSQVKQCGKCKGTEIVYVTIQPPAGDECTSILCRCTACNNKWIIC